MTSKKKPVGQKYQQKRQKKAALMKYAEEIKSLPPVVKKKAERWGELFKKMPIELLKGVLSVARKFGTNTSAALKKMGSLINKEGLKLGIKNLKKLLDKFKMTFSNFIKLFRGFVSKGTEGVLRVFGVQPKVTQVKFADIGLLLGGAFAMGVGTLGVLIVCYLFYKLATDADVVLLNAIFQWNLFSDLSSALGDFLGMIGAGASDVLSGVFSSLEF